MKHGTIYLNKNRYWWKVKLPGSNKLQQIPLRPHGARFATKELAVAKEVAKALWKQAQTKGTKTDGRTITDLVTSYMRHCRTYYQNSSEADSVWYAVDFLQSNTDVAYAEDFTPLRLQDLRDEMIDKGLSRSVINKRINMLKRMFKWAASQQLVPVAVYQALATVENLKAGRSRARETKKINPVPEEYVMAILPYLKQTGRAMVRLQLLTGMRSTELCMMRPCDIETSGHIWLYRPIEHKTAYRGHKRLIAIGPKGQRILRPFLKRKLNDYCFTPAEEYGKKGRYSEHYDRNSYRRMLQYAIQAANRDGKEVPHWHPHQLRHTAGTKVRKEFGREAARAFLGHRNPEITDDYAEIDMTLAEKAALRLG